MKAFNAWLLIDLFGTYAPTLHTTRQRSKNERDLLIYRDARWSIVRVTVREKEKEPK